MDDTIRTHQYANGLVLVAEPMDWLSSAAFTLMVPAGTVYEPDDRSGLAAFVCEMSLRGAGTRNSRQFMNDLESLGVEWSESVSDAHVAYSGATVSDRLPAALALFADVVQRPLLPAEELEPSRLVLLQELKALEDDPARKLLMELRGRYFPAPWGRPSQGRQESLLAVSLRDIEEYFARCFRPAGSVLVVAGRFSWPALVDCVAEHFGRWPARAEVSVTETTAPRGYTHLEADVGQIQIGVAYPGVPYRDPDYFRAWGAVGVLGGGTSSRLFSEVRERRGLCYGVSAAYYSLKDHAGVFCHAATTSRRAQETLDVLLAELVRLGRGIEPEELGRLKARIKSALILQQESSSTRSMALARDWYHLGRCRTLDELGSLVDGLSCQSINAYLAEHPPGDFTVVTLGPKPLEVSVGVS